MATAVGKNSRGGIKKVGKNNGGSSGGSSKKINYNFDSTRETANQYHARIGRERGDSADYVKTMQRGATKTFRERGLDADKLTTPRSTPVITPDKLGPVQEPSVPQMPQDNTDWMSMLTQGNASLAGTGLEYDATNAQLKPAQVDPTMKMLMDVMQETPNTEDIYNRSMKESGLLQAQKEVNNYSSQLNAITSKAQADQLRLEGQGRGITDVIIGGQQAQIAREAAIQALPIQAQLAAAQGNMEMAQQRLTMLFQVRSQDAQARYQTRVNMANALVQYADKKQAQALELYKMNRQEAFQREMDQLGFEHQKQMLALQESYKRPEPVIPTTRDFSDGTTRQYNPTTGAWDILSNKPIDPQDVQAEQSQEKRRYQAATQAEIVIKKVNEALGQTGLLSTGFIGGATGWLPGSPGKNLNKTVETIKANLGFAELQKMRENSPTGGALGQVAIQELEALQSTIASLDISQDRDQLDSNLNQISTHYKNWLETMGYTVAPDGTVVEIIWGIPGVNQ